MRKVNKKTISRTLDTNKNTNIKQERKVKYGTYKVD